MDKLVHRSSPRPASWGQLRWSGGPSEQDRQLAEQRRQERVEQERQAALERARRVRWDAFLDEHAARVSEVRDLHDVVSLAAELRALFEREERVAEKVQAAFKHEQALRYAFGQEG